MFLCRCRRRDRLGPAYDMVRPVLGIDQRIVIVPGRNGDIGHVGGAMAKLVREPSRHAAMANPADRAELPPLSGACHNLPD